MSDKMPWEKVLEETLPPRGEYPPHFLLAEGQKLIWEKLLEIEYLLKQSN